MPLVTPVRSASDRRAFIELPFRLYRGDPYWVPPLRSDVAEMLDPRRHPFHRHAEVEFFLARSPTGRVVGRIAAIKNDLHIQHHNEAAGFFGFFECERESEVAAALFGAARGWLAERGMALMRGPASFSSNEEWGLLVHGFDSPPVVMMPYNPPWYADLIEEYGFRKAKDVLAYYLDGGDHPERIVPERVRHAAELLSKRHQIVIRPMNMREFWREVECVRTIYNAAWEKNWGFIPMTEEEFMHLAKKMKQVVDPDLILFAEVDRQLAGMAIVLPDVNRALKHVGGRLFPIGWLKALWHSRGIDTCRVLTLGVLEPFRRTGAAEMMYLYIWQTCPRKGITKGEFSWILEDNTVMRAGVEKLGARVYKIYRLYDLTLDA